MLTIEINQPNVSRQWRTTARRLHYPHDKPAYTNWHSNGQKHYEGYYLNDQCHRDDDKPARTDWNLSGQRVYEAYALRDRLHRENDKPAATRWNSDGQRSYEAYYLNGIQCFPKKPIC